jgi:hypothetical protein
MKGGLKYADRLTTVSPSHTREIATPEFGCGLDGVLLESSTAHPPHDHAALPSPRKPQTQPARSALSIHARPSD